MCPYIPSSGDRQEIVTIVEKPSLFLNTRLLAMDVDGVLTDGTLGYDSSGSEQKRFHVADGLGLTLLRLSGISTAWISGRSNPAVERRAAELKIDYLVQSTRDKGAALSRIATLMVLRQEEIAFIGDDYNDLLAFETAGIRIAVSNAVPEVKAAAHFVTSSAGGSGAVREVCELLLTERGMREEALQSYLSALKAESLSDPGQ
jgi:3-deoxy-D-manno-octulosonate 8-phosphate phosphatase (KDO 8-P phosphatase)